MLVWRDGTWANVKKNTKLLYLNYSTFPPCLFYLVFFRSLLFFLFISFPWHKTHNNSMNIFGDKFISLSYEKINFIYYFSFFFATFKQVSGNDDDDILFICGKLIPSWLHLFLSVQRNEFCGSMAMEKKVRSLIDFWLMPPYLMIVFCFFWALLWSIGFFLRSFRIFFRLLSNNE